jgi:glycosyltransferase involved in cell wall biosynthesis
LANAHARGEIIAHFDDDDWSHPNRIAEQVALLQASGADVVGYNEALFWQTLNFCNKCGYSGSLKEHAFCNYDAYGIGGIAWLYRCPSPSYGLGSSLCYWRRVWEQKPFADINHGEDMRFITGLKVVGVSANYDVRTVAPVAGPMRWDAGDECEPRMICSIHGNNTSVYAPEKDRNMWRRAASFDDYCERTMKL